MPIIPSTVLRVMQMGIMKEDVIEGFIEHLASIDNCIPVSAMAPLDAIKEQIDTIEWSDIHLFYFNNRQSSKFLSLLLGLVVLRMDKTKIPMIYCSVDDPYYERVTWLCKKYDISCYTDRDMFFKHTLAIAEYCAKVKSHSVTVQEEVTKVFEEIMPLR